MVGRSCRWPAHARRITSGEILPPAVELVCVGGCDLGTFDGHASRGDDADLGLAPCRAVQPNFNLFAADAQQDGLADASLDYLHRSSPFCRGAVRAAQRAVRPCALSAPRPYSTAVSPVVSMGLRDGSEEEGEGVRRSTEPKVAGSSPASCVRCDRGRPTRHAHHSPTRRVFHNS